MAIAQLISLDFAPQLLATLKGLMWISFVEWRKYLNIRANDVSAWSEGGGLQLAKWLAVLVEKHLQGSDKLLVEQLIAGRDRVVDKLEDFTDEGWCGHSEVSCVSCTERHN